MRNLRNKTDEHRGQKKVEKKEAKRQTLNYREQTDDYQREGGWGDG